MNVMDYGLKPIDFNAPRGDDVTGMNVTGMNRRTFLGVSLASGFALAAGPAAATTITTASDGLVAGEVSIPVGDREIPGYRAMPATDGPFPILLVVQEIFGVHEHIQDVCRRYARLGYYAIAPELFVRQGDVSGMTDIETILEQIVSKVPDEQVFSDLDATIAFAVESGDGEADRVALVGYCWGGRTAWMYAHHNPDLLAAVSYYGLLSGLKDGALREADPLDVAADLRVSVLGLYAGDDAFVQNDAMVDMREQLMASDSGSEIIVFPGVEHGFNADYRPSYDASAADYAARLAHKWLQRHGV